MKTVLHVVFAYNDIGHLSGVTELRCQKMVDISRQYGPTDAAQYCWLTAGYSKKSPTKPTSERTKSLAVQMHEYILGLYPELTLLGSAAHGWGTIEELMWSYRCAERAKLRYTDVHVVSSVDHLPRIRAYDAFIRPRHFPKPSFDSAKHYLCEPQKELTKLVKDTPRLLWLAFKVRAGKPL